MQRVNRACLTGIASKWQGTPPRSRGQQEWQPSRPHPRVRPRFAFPLPTELHVILRAKWLWAVLNWRTGLVISAEGVAPFAGACGTGKEEDGVGGVWIT